MTTITEKEIAETIYFKVKDRIKQIDYNQEKYDCDLKPCGNSFLVQVRYNDLLFLCFTPIISRTINGKSKSLKAVFQIHAIDDMFWYNNLLTNKDIDVNEKMMCQNNTKTFDSILEERIPLGTDSQKELIDDAFRRNHLDYSKISFDTISLRYVIQVDPKSEFIETKVEKCNQVYKYTTLSTFKKILEKGTFRLNSIISMNDTSEAFFLGDYLCDDYNDNIRKRFDSFYNEEDSKGLRYNKLLEYKNILISSFTTKYDDSLMWERYGDKYQGVCIAFEYNPKVMKPITYCGKNDDFFNQLKNVSKELLKKGIRVYYDFIDDRQFYVKHWQFEGESELRLIQRCEKSDLKFELYGNLLTYYHDYKFEELGLKPVGLLVGAMLPNKDLNFPLLCELAQEKLNINEVNISKCDKFRF